jgi:alpha-glucosidase
VQLILPIYINIIFLFLIVPALSAGMSGMGLFHFDIGGYTTIELLGLKRSKELLLRSAEMSVFTPIMRTHEGIY